MLVTNTSTLQRQARPGRTPEDEAQALSQALYRAVLAGPPKRCALMLKGPGADGRKYSDAPKSHRFSLDDVRDHLAGRRTWATTLADSTGLAVAGCRDYDAGGLAAIAAALTTAQQAGLVAFGIVVEGNESTGEHSGGHVWVLYRNPAPAAAICAQLRTLPGAKGEIYPSGNCVRLPLGLHRPKGTRGRLILQDGRIFKLDQADELAAGLRVLLALKRNGPPPAAPAAGTSGGSSFGTYDSAIYTHLAAMQARGAALMGAPRYQVLFRVRPQLARLGAGERVALYRDGVADDSSSAQVAVLISNLLTSCRKGQQPGQGAPPLDEIRAIALHWKPALRDKRSMAHYCAQIEYEIGRYTPTAYTPEPTIKIPGHKAPTPCSLQDAQPRSPGRPAGQRAAQGARLVEVIAAMPADDRGWRDTARAQLGAALGCGIDMTSKLLADARSAGHIETRQRQHGIAVRLVINSPAPPLDEACNCPIEDRATTPENAGEACMESHPRPPAVLVSDPAAGAGLVELLHQGQDTSGPPAGVSPSAEPLPPGLTWGADPLAGWLGRLRRAGPGERFAESRLKWERRLSAERPPVEVAPTQCALRLVPRDPLLDELAAILEGRDDPPVLPVEAPRPKTAAERCASAVAPSRAYLQRPQTTGVLTL